jgi:hypothetical protein
MRIPLRQNEIEIIRHSTPTDSMVEGEHRQPQEKPNLASEPTEVPSPLPIPALPTRREMTRPRKEVDYLCLRKNMVPGQPAPDIQEATAHETSSCAMAMLASIYDVPRTLNEA